jgi:hypothetical protein
MKHRVHFSESPCEYRKRPSQYTLPAAFWMRHSRPQIALKQAANVKSPRKRGEASRRFAKEPGRRDTIVSR